MDDYKSLIESSVSGDRSATQKLIEGIQNELFSFCFYLSKNRAQAEDLCQETLINAIEKLHKLREPSKFKSWVFTSARNLFLDQFKSQREDLIPFHPEISADETQFQNLAIREALLLLKPEDRLILILVDLNSFSYQETAAIMKLSEEAVTSRLFRARQEFLKKF